jgi:hypothetical protein
MKRLGHIKRLDGGRHGSSGSGKICCLPATARGALRRWPIPSSQTPTDAARITTRTSAKAPLRPSAEGSVAERRAICLRQASNHRRRVFEERRGLGKSAFADVLAAYALAITRMDTTLKDAEREAERKPRGLRSSCPCLQRVQCDFSAPSFSILSCQRSLRVSKNQCRISN